MSKERYVKKNYFYLNFLISYTIVLPMGFSPRQVHYGFNVTKEMTVGRSWGERAIPNSISTSGRSLKSHPLRASLYAHTAIPVSVLSAATTPASALLQPCSRATMSPRALGRALYIGSIATYCPQVCSELANQGQVRILATGSFILSTTRQR